MYAFVIVAYSDVSTPGWFNCTDATFVFDTVCEVFWHFYSVKNKNNL